MVACPYHRGGRSKICARGMRAAAKIFYPPFTNARYATPVGGAFLCFFKENYPLTKNLPGFSKGLHFVPEVSN